MRQAFQKFSLVHQVASILLITTVVGFVGFTAFVAVDTNRSILRQSTTQLERDVELVSSMLNFYDQTLRTDTLKLGDIFFNIFPGEFSLEGNRRVPVAGIRGPALRHEGQLLNANFDAVDTFSAMTGGVATVFARDKNDFLRVTTSLKNERGDRAIGTYLGESHPGYAQLMEGREYFGHAHLFGRDYMTRYIPVEDAGGRVIAILFIGFDYTDGLASLRTTVSQLEVADNGQAMLIDLDARSRGELVTHDYLAGGRVEDLFMPEDVAFRAALLNDASGSFYYTPLAHGGVTGERLLAFKRVDAWGWVVAVEAPVSELAAVATRVRDRLILLGGVLVVVMTLLIFAIVKRGLAPIRDFIPVLDRIGAGDLDARLRVKGTVIDPEETSSRNEIRALGAHVNIMVKRFGDVVEDVKHAVEDAEAARRREMLANESTKMKSEFLANMSHEIRTPMNAVIGLAHLALKTELTARQRDYLTKIHGAGQHLLGLINDILDFSKIEAGKLTLEVADFELDKVLENVANLIGSKCADKNLELAFDVPAGIPSHVVGDSLRLSQILINYANNAVKFTESGEIVISVELLEQADESVLLKFSVRDTGIGLSEEQQARLFQSFQQADTSTSRKFGGTGLGLAISRQLALLMEGEVGVDSVLGEGSTFWFTARLSTKTSKPTQGLMLDDLRGKRVLVIDDNETARRVLQEMLQNMALTVELASSGELGIAAARDASVAGAPFDIVFMDWHMPPGINGIETARGIKALGLDNEPHLVMVTAYGREDVLNETSSAGLEYVLVKPVNPSLMFDTVTRVLGAEVETGQARTISVDPKAEIDLTAVRGSRILLAEDNRLNQQIAVELLQDVGMRVDVANHGGEAISMAMEGDYDLVLMDMQMPEVDGLEATRGIREVFEHDKLPIVAMTANASQADRERCLEAGMDEHIGKPIDPDQLYHTLSVWLKPKDQGDIPQTDMPKAHATEAPALDTLVGINTALGLKRSAGKERLYRTLLATFHADESDAPARLQAALAAGDLALAERIAHTVKGSAGSIGAEQVQSVAAEVERACSGGAVAEAQAQLEALTAALDEVMGGLAGLFAAQAGGDGDGNQDGAAEADASALSEDELRTLIATLRGFLENDDTDANELLDEQAAALASLLGERTVTEIREAVDNFDYEQALKHLLEALG